MDGGADLSLHRDGAVRHDGAALNILDDLEAALDGFAPLRAGVRLHGNGRLTNLLEPGSRIAALVATRLGPAARPVRTILFDKTRGTNWALRWHQDRTVAVCNRADVPGWGPWSTKSGIQHVEPPFAVMAQMTTLRIHLDPVPVDNAPLLIARGSHLLGRIAERDIEATVRRCGTAICLAERGDVWSYATPILHASAPSKDHEHRRVLQVDYAAGALELPLAWYGI